MNPISYARNKNATVDDGLSDLVRIDNLLGAQKEYESIIFFFQIH